MSQRHLLKQKVVATYQHNTVSRQTAAARRESLKKLYLGALQIIKSTNKSGWGDVEAVKWNPLYHINILSLSAEVCSSQPTEFDDLVSLSA